jgi:hypothetical protein
MDPLKRASYGREVGIKTEASSLIRLSLFTIKKGIRKTGLFRKIERRNFIINSSLRISKAKI